MRRMRQAVLGLLAWVAVLHLVFVAPARAVVVSAPVTNITVIKKTVFGDMVVVFGSARLPASYNGAVLTARALGMGAISFVQVSPVTSGGYSVTWDTATSSESSAVLRAFSGGSGGALTFTGDAVTPAFSGDAVTPTGVSSPPTFTVTKGAVLSSGTVGVSADANTATINNNTIAATLTLGTNTPVGTPSLTMDAVTPTGTIGAITPTGTITGGGGGLLGEVTGATDLSAEVVSFVVYGH